MGFGKSDSDSESTSQVWGAQQPFFTRMYGQGQNLAGQQMAQPGMDGQGMVDQMMPQMQQSWGQLMNPGENPMLNNYAQQLGRNFNQQIMPAISRDAQGINQLGGSRQGVAEGLAAQGAADAMGQFAGNQYNQDMNRMQAGLGQAQGMFNFGQAPLSAQWMPLQMQAGIMGSPTVLGSSEGSSSGFNFTL